MLWKSKIKNNMIHSLRNNYRKGYDIILQERLQERKAKGLPNDKYPNQVEKIKLYVLAVGASMALTVADKAGQEEPHVPLSLWLAEVWLYLMALLIMLDII